MPAYEKVRVRTASVLVADVAFADIAGHDEDLLGRVMQPCFAPGHGSPQTLGAEQHPGRVPAGSAFDRSGVSVAARTTAVTTTTTTAGSLAILRFIDLEGAPVEVGAIQRLHRT
jgi:hypothetical protein